MSVRPAALTAVLVLLCTVTAPAQPGPGGGIAGKLVDESGAALPGVTVSIACVGSGGVIATVTDAAGAFAVAGLPAGTCSVVFELAGFETVMREQVQVPDGQVVGIAQQLGLAGYEEVVNVVAQAPPVREVLPPKPRPRLQPAAVPPHDVDSVCGPGRPAADTIVAARLAGHRDDGERILYAPGDAIVLDAGRADGLAVGQNFVVRRRYRVSDLPWNTATIPTGVHSAGLVQVVEVSETSAIAAVVYACDEFVLGDELEPFVPEPFWSPKADGPPDFDQPVRVLFGDEGKMLGAPRTLMVLDRGLDAGLQAGMRVTLFRRTRFGRGAVSRIGEAVVVAVRADWSRIRIESVHDAVYSGDQAAPHRPATNPAAQQ